MQSWISKNQLYEEFCVNREIEFSIQNLHLFATPTTTPPENYKVWDVDRHICIASGKIDEIFSHKFLGKYSLRDNFDAFDIEYVL